MKNRRGQEGQFVIEAILLMSITVAVFVVLTKLIRDQKIATKMVTGPWSKIAGMTEFGVWAQPDAASKKKHPNSYNRFFTPKE